MKIAVNTALATYREKALLPVRDPLGLRVQLHKKLQLDTARVHGLVLPLVATILTQELHRDRPPARSLDAIMRITTLSGYPIAMPSYEHVPQPCARTHQRYIARQENSWHERVPDSRMQSYRCRAGSSVEQLQQLKIICCNRYTYAHRNESAEG